MNQRANGEGSIYRRADGRWTAACYVLRPDGTRVRRSVYSKTRKDVPNELAVLITKTKAGLPLTVESWTLERFAEHWLRDVVGGRLRPSTRSSYRETLHLHILPTLGRMNLCALTPTHVRTLLANKAADGLGTRSVQIIHSTLRTMLSDAMREELIELNSGAGEGYQRMIKASAAGRVGTPNEIGAAAAFLMGRDGTFITGTDLLIDGGVIAAIAAGRYQLTMGG